jgi:hypothetical protein
MNALRLYFNRLDDIAERFEAVTERRFHELTGQARDNFSAMLGMHYFKRSMQSHPVNDFVQCERVVGVLS